MQFPITIGLHRSRFLDAGILLTAGLATVAILYFPRSLTVQCGLIVVLWGFSALAWRQACPALRAIRLERDGRILISGIAHDEFLPATLLPGATVHRWLSLIRLKTEAGRVLTLIATVDSLEKEDFRRLRVFLRWQADFSAERGGT